LSRHGSDRKKIEELDLSEKGLSLLEVEDDMFPSLKKLSLAKNNLSGRTLRHLKKIPALEELDLSSNQFTDVSFKTNKQIRRFFFAKNISICGHAKKISLICTYFVGANCILFSFQFVKIADLIDCLPKLKLINVDNNPCMRDDLKVKPILCLFTKLSKIIRRKAGIDWI
jgi:Leucine-rich repeat (LRR) protein